MLMLADYLQIHFVAGTGELAVLCGAVIGAGLGFLWFNAPPASIFMGDTGSLALGGMLGTIAVATKHEIVLAVVGGLFVLEAVSVIVQVVSFKLTGKRVFRMAPLHHHFEQKGWTEPQIVIRFWIISVVLALVGPVDAEAAVNDPRHQFRRQESRGVRARRLGAGQRQRAARRRRRRRRLGRQCAIRSRRRPAPASPPPTFAHVDWSKIAALVLAPGVPLTHPAPHWTVGLARAAAVEVIGDIELFCRERRRHAPNAPFVAITGTNGKSTTTALIAHLVGMRRLRRRRSAATSAPRSCRWSRRGRGRVHVIEVRPIRSISRPRSIRRSAS